MENLILDRYSNYREYLYHKGFSLLGSAAVVSAGEIIKRTSNEGVGSLVELLGIVGGITFTFEPEISYALNRGGDKLVDSILEIRRRYIK